MKIPLITDDAKLGRLLYNEAKEMLYYRSGTEYENMYWIDASSTSVLASVLDEQSIEEVTV